jgi:hypothetical protein
MQEQVLQLAWLTMLLMHASWLALLPRPAAGLVDQSSSAYVCLQAVLLCTVA